ncbi:unnamed protein product [Lactuca saligna]|uniref:HAT C-terminal dimerisation domain-containing protein n=1 Tax=Lactuca saligna TaxID=75948 RepID=A0AA35VN81_LACSI|nr:unnamed protein product [Lactuca saligna]
MESSRIDVDLDGESEFVEQNKVPVVGDKRTSNAWRNYTDVRDPKTGKIVKAQCKHCSRILTVTTKNDAFVRIRGAVRYVRSSTERSKLFDTCVSKSKILSKAAVSIDVPTRWNATYIMLETALKFEKAFKRMRQEDPAFEKDLKDGFPSQKDWESARNLSLCLKRFFKATKRMSGTLYVTANMHYHEILGVLASLLEWTQDDDINIALMGDQMRKKFDKYYGEFGKTNVMVLVAVALDPRYNMRFVKFSLRKIYPLGFKKVEELYAKVFEWWSDKCTTYKVLASIAKDILAIPVSMVASESAFSTFGRVVDDFHSNLLPKTVEALICTQD